MKYIKNEFPEPELSTQSEISDELAELWIKNGNPNISDNPWPDMIMVPSYIVVEGSSQMTDRDVLKAYMRHVYKWTGSFECGDDYIFFTNFEGNKLIEEVKQEILTELEDKLPAENISEGTLQA